MALIKCKDCKKEFSADAKCCPNCRVKPSCSMGKTAGWLIIIGLIYAGVTPGNHTVVEAIQTNEAKADTTSATPHSATSTPSISSDAPETSPTKSPPTITHVHYWSVNNDTSEMDDSKTVELYTTAENLIPVWLNEVRPTLYIRCQEGKTALFMVTETAAQPELGRYNTYTVEIRIDDGKVYKEHWQQSTDSKALFAPSPTVLAKKLNKANRLRIRFVPFNSSPATVEFDVGGLDTELPKVAHACKWVK